MVCGYLASFLPSSSSASASSSSGPNIDLFGEIVVLPRDDEKEARLCEVRGDAVGGIYLYAHQFSSCSSEEIPVEELSAMGRLPAMAEARDEYLQLLDEYRGERVELGASFISGLLNDIALNVPNETLVIKWKGGAGVISNQVISDIRRRHSLIVNGKSLLNPNSHDDFIELIIRDWSDPHRAKATFERCLSLLDGDFNLTSHVMKLTTQATLTRLYARIQALFFNEKIHSTLVCIRQDIFIETRFGGVAAVTYRSIWKGFDFENPEMALDKYLTASIVMKQDIAELTNGRAKGAVATLYTSKFFSTLKEAESCNFDIYFWPSGAETVADYMHKVESTVAVEEKMPLFICHTWEEPLKHLLRERSARGFIPELLFTDLSCIQRITVNDESTASLDNPEMANTIYQHCLALFGDPNLAQMALCLASKGIYSDLKLMFQSRYTNPLLDRHVDCKQYEITIRSDASDCINIELESIWSILDLSKQPPTDLKFMSIKILAPVSRGNLSQGLVKLLEEAEALLSPFYPSIEEAKSYAHNDFSDWIRV